MSDTCRYFAVFDRNAQRIAGFGTDVFPTAEAATGHLRALERRRESIKAAAEREEAQGFPDGNHYWHLYHHDGGWKDADWVVVYRDVTPWRPVA